jgi:hypothetical protein
LNRVDWTPGVVTDVATYEVFYNTTGLVTRVGTGDTLVGSVPVATNTINHTKDLAAEGATTVYYSVFSKSGAGVYSTSGAAVTAAKYAFNPDPSGFAGVANDADTTTLTWVNSTDANVISYDVWFNITGDPVGSGAGNTLVGNVLPTAGTIVHTLLAAEQAATTVHYGLVGKSASGATLTTWQQTSVPKFTEPPPAPPITPGVTVVSPVINTVTWQPPAVTTNIANYEVFYSPTAAVTTPAGGTSIGSVLLGVHTLDHTKDGTAEAATTVYYGIFSKSATGVYSATGAQITGGRYAFTADPTNFAGVANSATQTTLTWVDSVDTNVLKYDIYYDLLAGSVDATDTLLIADIAKGTQTYVHQLGTGTPEQNAATIYYGLVGKS